MKKWPLFLVGLLCMSVMGLPTSAAASKQPTVTSSPTSLGEVTITVRSPKATGACTLRLTGRASVALGSVKVIRGTAKRIIKTADLRLGNYWLYAKCGSFKEVRATAMLRVVPALATMTREQINTDFRAWPVQWPQIAQWLRIDRPTKFSTVAFDVALAEVASPGWWQDKGRWDLVSLVKPGQRITGTTVRTQIWRAEGANASTNDFDLGSGFTKVATSEDVSPVVMSEMQLRFAQQVSLRAGHYVAVIQFETQNPDVLMIGLGGHQHGDSQIGSSGEFIPCTFAPQKDVYTQGSAFRSADPGISLVRGNKPPMLSSFVPLKAKVNECTQIGRYSDIYHDGDIYLVFR